MRINYQIVYSFYAAETERLLQSMWNRFSEQWESADLPSQVHQGLFLMSVLGMFSTCGISVSKKREDIQKKLALSVQVMLTEPMTIADPKKEDSLVLVRSSSNQLKLVSAQQIMKRDEELIKNFGNVLSKVVGTFAENIRMTHERMDFIQEAVTSLKKPIDSAVSILTNQRYEANKEKVFFFIRLWIVMCFGTFLLRECEFIIYNFSDYSEDIWFFVKHLLLDIWTNVESFIDSIFVSKWYGINIKKWMAITVICFFTIQHITSLFRVTLNFVFSYLHWFVALATLWIQFWLKEYNSLILSFIILICIFAYYLWIPKYRYCRIFSIGITVAIFYYYLK